MWDRYAIKAEIYRRGQTLIGIARIYGLPEAACRQALHHGHRAGESAIADFLGMPRGWLFNRRAQFAPRRAIKPQIKAGPGASHYGSIPDLHGKI